MATILEFRAAASQASAAEPNSQLRQTGRPAEVVIFPGVRIEREPREETQVERHDEFKQ